MWRLSPIVVGALALGASGSAADTLYVAHDVVGSWALESEAPSEYVLAASGTPGAFLICFTAGNTRRIVVAVGDERSNLARGSCTVFSPTADDGIVVEFPAGGQEPPSQSVALGTFRLILPPAE